MYMKHRLSNGINVYLSKLPVYRSASIGFWFKTGSINETSENNGIAHFIEHMIFKGTKKRTAKEIAEFFDHIGGDLNAFTSKECTCFHARVLDQHLSESIEVIGDMLSDSLMDESEIIKEKGVVLDEIMMAEDTPDDVSYDLIAETVYGKGSLAQPILGTKESVNSITTKMIVDYMNQYYTTDNIVISLAGSFDTEEVLSALEEFLILPKGEKIIEPIQNVFNTSSSFIYKDIEQVHLEIAYEGISYCSQKIFDLAALNALIGASVSSRLFQTIRENHGLTYAINSYVSQYESSGLFNIYASMHKDNLYQVVDLIQEELKDVIHKGITALEVERVKEQLKGNYILDLEGSESYMNLIGKGKLFNKTIYTIEEIENKINNITLDSVYAIVEEVLQKVPTFTLVGRVGQEQINYCASVLQEVI